MRDQVILVDVDILTDLADKLPSNHGRLSLVQELIRAYALHKYCQIIDVVAPVDTRVLTQYHDADFINHIFAPRLDIDKQDEHYNLLSKRLDSIFPFDKECLIPQDQTEEESLSLDEYYGLTHDCYVFPFMRHYVALTAASTIELATHIARMVVNSRDSDDLHIRPIGINWYGGRHHCHRAKCSGFCYINDVVLGINALRKLTSATVFYLDLDLHHGDGISQAFQYSKKVTTCSIHRFDVGFFPGTGDVGASVNGDYNISMKRGLNDESLRWIVENIVQPLIQKHQPQYLFIQCGCDGLSTDPHKEWNLTICGYARVIKLLLDAIRIPVILLGGGGYNFTEAAKFWTYLTALVTEIPISDTLDDIPEHKCLDNYENDGYRFWTDRNTQRGKMNDENDPRYLESIRDYLLNL